MLISMCKENLYAEMEKLEAQNVGVQDRTSKLRPASLPFHYYKCKISVTFNSINHNQDFKFRERSRKCLNISDLEIKKNLLSL